MANTGIGKIALDTVTYGGIGIASHHIIGHTFRTVTMGDMATFVVGDTVATIAASMPIGSAAISYIPGGIDVQEGVLKFGVITIAMLAKNLIANHHMSRIIGDAVNIGLSIPTAVGIQFSADRIKEIITNPMVLG